MGYVAVTRHSAVGPSLDWSGLLFSVVRSHFHLRHHHCGQSMETSLESATRLVPDHSCTNENAPGELTGASIVILSGQNHEDSTPKALARATMNGTRGPGIVTKEFRSICTVHPTTQSTHYPGPNSGLTCAPWLRFREACRPFVVENQDRARDEVDQSRSLRPLPRTNAIYH